MRSSTPASSEPEVFFEIFDQTLDVARRGSPFSSTLSCKFSAITSILILPVSSSMISFVDLRSTTRGAVHRDVPVSLVCWASTTSASDRSDRTALTESSARERKRSLSCWLCERRVESLSSKKHETRLGSIRDRSARECARISRSRRPFSAVSRPRRSSASAPSRKRDEKPFQDAAAASESNRVVPRLGVCL